MGSVKANGLLLFPMAAPCSVCRDESIQQRLYGPWGRKYLPPHISPKNQIKTAIIALINIMTIMWVGVNTLITVSGLCIILPETPLIMLETFHDQVPLPLILTFIVQSDPVQSFFLTNCSHSCLNVVARHQGYNAC